MVSLSQITAANHPRSTQFPAGPEVYQAVKTLTITLQRDVYSPEGYLQYRRYRHERQHVAATSSA